MLSQKDITGPDMVPESAIIIYNQSGSSYYLEKRSIKKTNQGYQMMNGVSLKKETLKSIMETIEVDEADTIYCDGIFPSKLLAFKNGYGNESIVWFIKSSWRNLSFSKKLGIKDKQFHIPSLVFKLDGGKLSVFAAKTDNVDKATKLFRAPFHNIFSDGGICMGNAKVKKSYEVNEIMKAYEDAFFMSKFTHLQSGGSPIKGNLNTYLNSNDKIEKKVLLPTKLKVEDLV